MPAYVDFDGVGDYATAPHITDTFETLEIRYRIENFDTGARSYNSLGGWRGSAGPGVNFWVRNTQVANVDPNPGTINDVGTGAYADTSDILDDRWIAIKIEWPPTGTGTLTATSYYSNDDTLDHSAVSWTELDSDTDSLTSETMPIDPTGSFVVAGYTDNFASDAATVEVYRAVFLADDVVIADFFPDGDAASSGDTSWDDPQGNTWTLTGTTVTGTPSGRGQAIADSDTPGGFTLTTYRSHIIADSDTPGGTTLTVDTSKGGEAITDSDSGAFRLIYEYRWQIPSSRYTNVFMSAGQLPVQPEGGELVSAVRVLSSSRQALYSSLEEDGVVQLPLEVDAVTDDAEGFVVRSARMRVPFETDVGVVPEHAPTNLGHPLRSWSGALVEIYVGWQVQVDEYNWERQFARRATLGVGSVNWNQDPAGHILTVDLVDMRKLLDEDLDAAVSFANDTKVSDVLEELVSARFGDDVTIEKEETDYEVPEMSLEVGESRLGVIDDLEHASGLGVSFDPRGRAVIASQLPTVVRTLPTLQFGDGVGQLMASAPTVVSFNDGAISGVEIKASSFSNEEAEYTFTAWDSDPLSPTYWEPGNPFASFGVVRPIVKRISTELVHCVDCQEMLRRGAWASLRRYGRGGGDLISFHCPPVPQLQGGDPILLNFSSLGISNKWYTVLSVRCPLRPDDMVVVARPSWDPSNGEGDI